MISRRSMVAGSLAAIGTGLLPVEQGISGGQNADAETQQSDGQLLSLAERRAQLRNWFVKYTGECAPVAVTMFLGGKDRILGELKFLDGSRRQMCVGRDPDETDDLAAEFRVEFAKYAKLFCPTLPVSISGVAES
jgi:hypothetical protein